MVATATQMLGLSELAELLDLPRHVVRRAIDRYGLAPPKKYPRQHVGFPASRLNELRRRLETDGYVLPRQRTA